MSQLWWFSLRLVVFCSAHCRCAIFPRSRLWGGAQRFLRWRRGAPRGEEWGGGEGNHLGNSFVSNSTVCTAKWHHDAVHSEPWNVRPLIGVIAVPPGHTPRHTPPGSSGGWLGLGRVFLFGTGSRDVQMFSLFCRCGDSHGAGLSVRLTG